jgi:muramidase (phage lysozyme)
MNPNVPAFIRVLREGETNQNNDAYTMLNGGGHFTSFADHPYAGQSAPPGLAAGAVQWLPHTWGRWKAKLGLPDFSPASQDAATEAQLAELGAIPDIEAGNVYAAMQKCRDCWVSMRTLDVNRATAVFKQYGGTLADTQPAAPIEDQSTPLPQSQPEKSMGALALLQLFGPILSTMIPQISTLLKPGSKAAGYAGIAQTVLDTITSTAKSPNLQGAIEAMQSDPSVKAAVQQAVVTHPEIIGVLEIGGGIQAARTADLAAQIAEKPFWYSPAIWVAAALLPLVYWIVGGVLVGGIDIPADAKWLQFLKIFGTAFNAETRSGMVNLVLGMVLGGIVGMYFGTSYGSMRKTELAAVATADDKAPA